MFQILPVGFGVDEAADAVPAVRYEEAAALLLWRRNLAAARSQILGLIMC